jgi:hypothetical protein
MSAGTVPWKVNIEQLKAKAQAAGYKKIEEVAADNETSLEEEKKWWTDEYQNHRIIHQEQTPYCQLWLIAEPTSQPDAQEENNMNTISERLEMLNVFAEYPATFDIEAMAAVWNCSAEEAAATAEEMVMRGLIGHQEGRYWTYSQESIDMERAYKADYDLELCNNAIASAKETLKRLWQEEEEKDPDHIQYMGKLYDSWLSAEREEHMGNQDWKPGDAIRYKGRLCFVECIQEANDEYQVLTIVEVEEGYSGSEIFRNIQSIDPYLDIVTDRQQIDAAMRDYLGKHGAYETAIDEDALFVMELFGDEVGIKMEEILEEFVAYSLAEISDDVQTDPSTIDTRNRIMNGLSILIDQSSKRPSEIAFEIVRLMSNGIPMASGYTTTNEYPDNIDEGPF